MKLLLLLLPLLGMLTLAQTVHNEECHCPEVKCAADDPVALCECLNGRERKCEEACTSYKPTIASCVPQPTAGPIKTPKPTTSSLPCICEQVGCLQVWPDSCYCENGAAQRCYDKCGGPKPKLQSCSTGNDVFPVPEPVPILVPEPVTPCTCDDVMCIQMLPESCYCARAAEERCYKKCGGKKPKPQKCPPRVVKTLITEIQTGLPTPTPTLPSTPRHKVCGGGRANQFSCDEGDICITDPYSHSCGPACDALGICVKDEPCGGFRGVPCKVPGQICNDDPRDDCDPRSGGADCEGLCVWPHKVLHEG